ncbi:hypothetical protein R52603_05768 [Paraburkholderia saeva]|nr:hypothetical protein R52603_05768 [Paraburkholderia saeva]
MEVPLRSLVTQHPAAMAETRERLVGILCAVLRIGGIHREHVIRFDVVRQTLLHADLVLPVMPASRPQRQRVDLEQVDHGRAEQAEAVAGHRIVAGDASGEFDLEGHLFFPGGQHRAIEAAQVDKMELLRKHEVLQHRLLAVEFLVALRVQDGPQPRRRTEPCRLEGHPPLSLQRAITYRWQPQANGLHLMDQGRVECRGGGPVAVQVQPDTRQVDPFALFAEPQTERETDHRAPIGTHRDRRIVDRERQQFDGLRGPVEALHLLEADGCGTHHGAGRDLRRRRGVAVQGTAFDD